MTTHSNKIQLKISRLEQELNSLKEELDALVENPAICDSEFLEVLESCVDGTSFELIHDSPGMIYITTFGKQEDSFIDFRIEFMCSNNTIKLKFEVFKIFDFRTFSKYPTEFNIDSHRQRVMLKDMMNELNLLWRYQKGVFGMSICGT